MKILASQRGGLDGQPGLVLVVDSSKEFVLDDEGRLCANASSIRCYPLRMRRVCLCSGCYSELEEAQASNEEVE